MAEGWANYLKPDRVRAFSAGVAPKGVHPRAAAVMAEAGVDITGQRSKHVDELKGTSLDYVVTVCGHAHEQCPTFTGGTKVVHMGFEDPAETVGHDEEVTEKFREVRERIRQFVETIPESLLET
jgi:arsenate reductase